MKLKKQVHGITLVALVVTIIILLILASITMILIIGSDGIIYRAIIAKNEYEKATKNEQEYLDNLYSSIKIADNDDAEITIKMKELKKIIDEAVEEKMPKQATGIKTDTYIYNERTVATAYGNITSMEGFTKKADVSDNISKYFSYSDVDGYTVLKEGWYYIKLYALVEYATSDADTNLRFFINGNQMADIRACSNTSGIMTESDAYSIYLKNGDKIYFSAEANHNAKSRVACAYVYPMF